VTADPFATPDDSRVTARQEIITAGRYRLPRRDGTHKPYGWQRVSNLVSAYSDQFALRMWEIEQTLRGVAMDKALYTELLDTELPADKEARKRWVEGFVERCKGVAGGAEGARYGNHRHAVVEDLHAGLPMAGQPADVRRQASLYSSALVRHGLRAMPGMQERRVLVEELEVVGTLDNIVNDYVADLKTQKRFWTFLEIAAQLATYAHGDAMWDPETGTWRDMPTVRHDVALVLWMPRVHPSGEPAVDVYEVDIAAGWETAKHAYKIVKDRSSAKKRGWLRPAPPVTETERYAALFASVDSAAEGRALVAEVRQKGLWGPVLADCATAARDRLLTVTKN
jgi:hypothetical protein